MFPVLNSANEISLVVRNAPLAVRHATDLCCSYRQKLDIATVQFSFPALREMPGAGPDPKLVIRDCALALLSGFEQLVQVLNEAYGANIVIGNPAIRDMKLNASFYNESLDQVLEVISLTFNINVTRTANQVVLQ